MLMRDSGLLLHITSLAGPERSGTIGRPARELIDFLSAGGTKIWQMLPIGPVGYGNSPYQSPSTFAGNPLLIDIADLKELGLLSHWDAPAVQPDKRVDFSAAQQEKQQALRRSFEESFSSVQKDLERFFEENPWALPYARYMALSGHYGWFDKWPAAAKRHMKTPDAETEKLLNTLSDEIHYHLYVQYVFDLEWKRLRAYAAQKNVQLFGDIPIYVAPGSADVWQHPELFQVDRDLNPKRVAGVPPDCFSEDGQLWGNPLYSWLSMWFHGYQWWIDRLNSMKDRFDLIRIDHFIGFANYYSIPAGAKTAKNGKWVKNNGILFFDRVKKKIPDLNIIAEDLGLINDRVKKMIAHCGYPGMKLVMFGLDGDENNGNRPENIPEHCVAYTGTHDNDTVAGWWALQDSEARKKALDVLRLRPEDDFCDGIVRAVLSCKAERAVIPMQDYLALDNDARMNHPGTVGGINWQYRMMPGDLSDPLLKRISLLNREYGRFSK